VRFDLQVKADIPVCGVEVRARVRWIVRHGRVAHVGKRTVSAHVAPEIGREQFILRAIGKGGVGRIDVFRIIPKFAAFGIGVSDRHERRIPEDPHWRSRIDEIRHGSRDGRECVGPHCLIERDVQLRVGPRDKAACAHGCDFCAECRRWALKNIPNLDHAGVSDRRARRVIRAGAGRHIFHRQRIRRRIHARRRLERADVAHE
jgi:hypothetical protein